MSKTKENTQRDDKIALAAIRLERRTDGQLWLLCDGDEPPQEATQATEQNADTDSRADAEGKADAGDKTDADSKADADGKADAIAVRIAPCFPWSRTGQYLSLRTTDDKEVALIRDLDELAEDTRHLVEAALAEIGFVLEITHIQSIRTEMEIRNWQVETRQGPCTFQTKLDDWPRPLVDGGSENGNFTSTAALASAYILRDVAGNLYRILPDELDAPSRKLLWPFVG